MVETEPSPIVAPVDPHAGAGRDETAAVSAGRLARRRRPVTPAVAAERSSTGTIDVRIGLGDPLLAFLAAAPGPVDVSALPEHSPAVAHLIAQGASLVVPLVASGEMVGVLALGPRRSERTYTRNDRRLLESLARYAAPALRLGQILRQRQGEARERERMEQELHVAQLIQQQFLPTTLPDLPGWHVAALYRPARTVGGDFYDLIPLADGRVMVVTGDVTDKGVPAALVMASTHALLRSTAAVESSPGAVLQRVNDLLVPQIPVNMFVTCLVMVIDPATGATTFANAGHNLPYVRRNGRVTSLVARGMPLGLMAASRYDEYETVIERGDVVLLYSDGITEQHDGAGEMFGFGRTERVVADAESGERLVDHAISALGAFAGSVEQEDDITLVALHRGLGDGDGATVTFTVPSEPGREREAMDRVDAIVGDTLAEARRDALRTAVSETAMNAIEHGNRARADLDVEVTVRRSPDAVTVDVADFGRGRHGEADLPDLELKLAGLQTSRGWGLFLVANLVDRVEESSDGDRHTVRLVMHTGADPTAAPDTEGTPS